jgi:hypothetical protein
MDPKPLSFLDKITSLAQKGVEGFQDFRESNLQKGRDLEASVYGNTVGGLSADQVAHMQLEAMGLPINARNLEAAQIGYEPAVIGSIKNVANIVKSGQNLRNVAKLKGSALRENTGNGATMLFDDASKPISKIGKVTVKP